MGVDLQQALCYTGKLTSISLKCFEKVGRSWLNTVMINNPHMQSLSLYHTQHFAEEGNSFSLLTDLVHYKEKKMLYKIHAGLK